MVMFRLGTVGALLAGASLLAFAAPAAAQGKFQCPRKGGDFVFAQEAKANSLDQHTSSTISTRNVAMNMFESLMTRDDNMNPIPELAASVDESADKKTYTFKLREGIKFHNGKTMTSADVMASYDRYMKVGIDKGIYAIVDKYEAPDASTFIVRLKEPQPTFVENFSSFSVPVVIVPVGDHQRAADADADDRHRALPAGRVRRRQPGQDEALRRLSCPTRRTTTSTASAATRSPASTTSTSASSSSRARASPASRPASSTPRGRADQVADRLKSQQGHRPQAAAELLGPDRDPELLAAPTDNLKVRQAIQAALDMEEVMEAATDGAYRLNIGFQYPGQNYYTEAARRRTTRRTRPRPSSCCRRGATRARSSSCSPTATTRTCTTRR
jgi:peptide/nickel transport system substrate-binding protein